MCNHNKERLDEAPFQYRVTAEDRREILNESMTYKDFYKTIKRNLPFGAETSELPHKDYLSTVKDTNFVEMREDTMKFEVNSIYNTYFTYIKFDDWYDLINDFSLDNNEVARLAIWVSPIRVHCLCAGFKFWGMQYVATQLDAAIYDEDRFPKKRDPNLKSAGLCKHLRKTILHLGFNNQVIAQASKRQRKEIIS